MRPSVRDIVRRIHRPAGIPLALALSFSPSLSLSLSLTLTLTLAIALAPPASGGEEGEGAPGDGSGPELALAFGGSATLEGELRAVLESPAAAGAARIHALILAAADSDDLVGDLVPPAGAPGEGASRVGGLFTSAWARLDAALLDAERAAERDRAAGAPSPLEPLRREQDRLADAALRTVGLGGGTGVGSGVGSGAAAGRASGGGSGVASAVAPGVASAADLIAVYRRFPWSDRVHRALLEAAEADLRSGRPGLARRAFGDVISHAADPRLRAAARSGLWLATAALARDPGAIEETFRGVPPDAAFPWLGGTERADRIRERLLGSIEAAREEEPIRLEALEVVALRIPPLHPWDLGPRSHGPGARFPPEDLPEPFGRIVAVGDGAGGERWLLAGPGVLALFEPLSEPGRAGLRAGEPGTEAPRAIAPVWFRAPPAERASGREMEGGDALVVPGAYLPSISGDRIHARWGLRGGRPSGTAAFDLRDGTLLDAAAGPQVWEGPSPAADPVAAEGRLYVPAIRTDLDFLSPASLVCLSEETGAVLWRRSLGTHRPALSQRRGSRRLGSHDVDPARWGSAVTVEGGSVYIAPGLGFVARLDARDGRVEWLRTYPRSGPGADAIARRRGTAPVLAGPAIVAVPRDRTGALAIERETGAILWDDPILPSDEIVGVLRGAVLRGAPGVRVGVGVGDGAGDGLGDRAGDGAGDGAGDAVALAGPRAIVAIDARTGRVLWDRAFDADLIGRPALAGGDLVVGTRDGLERIAAATGETVERRPWPAGDLGDGREGDGAGGVAGERPAAFALAPGRILTFGPGGVDPLLDRAEAVESQAGRPRSRIECVGPRIWAPSAAGGPPEDVFVLAGGVLRVLDARAPVSPRWSRLLTAGVDEILRVGDAAILVGRDRLTALDARTGRERWAVEQPTRAGRCLALQDAILLVDFRDRTDASALDAATGATLWRRSLGGGGRGVAALLEGRLHVVLDRPPRGDRRRDVFTQTIIDPRTGAIEEERAIAGILGREEGGEDLRMAVAGGSCFVLRRPATLLEIDLARGTVSTRAEDLDGRSIRRLRAAGDWVQLDAQWEERGRGDGEGDRRRRASWIFKAGAASPPVRRSAWGSIRDGVLLEVDSLEVRRVDLERLGLETGAPETGAETTYHAPSDPDRTARVSLTFAIEDGTFRDALAAPDALAAGSTLAAGGTMVPCGAGTLYLLSSTRPGGDGHQGLRIDAFDVASGAHIGATSLPDVAIDSGDDGDDDDDDEEDSQLRFRDRAIPAGGALWLAGPGGVDAVDLAALAAPRDGAAPGDVPPPAATGPATPRSPSVPSATPRSATVVHLKDGVRIDGSLAEWEPRSGLSIPLRRVRRGGALGEGALGEGARAGDRRGDGSPRPGEARLHLAHDRTRLLIGLRFPGPPVRLPARLDAAPGVRLEIGMSGRDSRWHSIDLGRLDRGRPGGPEGGPDGGPAGGPDGSPAWRSLSGDRIPDDAEIAVRRHPATGETCCEVAVPLEDLVDIRGGVRAIGLSLAVHDDRVPGMPGPSILWGSGLAPDRLFVDGHEAIHLSALASGAAEGQRAAIEAAPHLPSAFDAFLDEASIRAVSSDDLARALDSGIQRHPGAVTAPRLLGMDRALRLAGRAEPSAALAASARAAGVPEPIVRRYELQATAAVSQWAYLDGSQLPRSIECGFIGGLEPSGRLHAVTWLKPHGEWDSPHPRLPDRLPPRKWHELRVPLSVLGLNDVPIVGARFAQQGPSRVVWGPAAIEIGGRALPLIEPPGTAREPLAVRGPFETGVTSASWAWLAEPSLGGVPSHAGPEPPERYAVATHSIRGLRPAVDAHVVFPEDGPVVRQEVFLDAARPPRSIALSLHDGRERGPLLVWGESPYAARRMGPLPAAGTWAEIRAPLEWLGFEGRPILGAAFGVEGGRALWGPTTVEIDGAEALLAPLDPSPREVAPREVAPREAGGTSPGPDARAGPPSEDGILGPFLACDGRTAVEAPHAPALEPEALTLEAWFLNEETLGGREKRRWIAGKNLHEETAGHYALMIRGSQAGAYLNIAGKPERPFSVWSPHGKVAEGRWHHIAVTYDGADLALYLDGEPEGRRAVGRRREPGTGPFAIGKRVDGYAWFRGKIDEVVLHARALGPEEVRERFAARGARDAPGGGIVERWSFDDVSRPADGRAAALWVEGPPGAGGRAHTHEAPEGYASHDLALAEPFCAHIRWDRERAAAAVEASFPAIAGTPEARRFLSDALRLFPAERERRLGLLGSFVRAHPEWPATAAVLGQILGELREADGDPRAASISLPASLPAVGAQGPVGAEATVEATRQTPQEDPAEAAVDVPAEAAVEALIARWGVSRDVAYSFRRRHLGKPGITPAVLRIIAPRLVDLDGGLVGVSGSAPQIAPDAASPVASPVAPDAAPDAAPEEGARAPIAGASVPDAEAAAWEARATEAGRVSVEAPRWDPVTAAHAAAWVWCEGERDAVIETDPSDADVRAWIGGELVLDSRERAAPALPAGAAAVVFPAGASRIVLEISGRGPGASFGLEMVDRLGLGPPEGVALLDAPP